MHRTPNNAQNTQHKIGVAFSYLKCNEVDAKQPVQLKY